MAPGLHSHGIAAGFTLLAALLLTPPGHAAQHIPGAAVKAEASPRDDGGKLAGRPAGEGRPRPGRMPDEAAAPSEDDEADDPSPTVSRTPGLALSSPSASASDTPTRPHRYSRPHGPRAPYRQWEEPSEEEEAPAEAQPSPSTSTTAPAVADEAAQPPGSGDSDPRIHVLSMGAGLTLTGLGLGFLGLRLRRQ
ncbi:hypothetical protein GCM10020367_33170 [Streptomyces sannanensis]|uniref:Gram-positive cocci surface proteins LPxTG domain-containing protein n=1 Tax=Streptomyces sannanensis TaxID=285536 RepID=A0ABP6SDR9_9ACTN